MKSLRYQAGLSSIGWLLVIVLVGFGLLCSFKMIPAYVENRFIQEALRSLPTGDELTDMTKGEIKRSLSNFYTINNVRSAGSSQIEVERTQNKTLVNINYEVRVPLIYNIDVVMRFVNQLDSSRPDECCKPESDN